MPDAGSLCYTSKRDNDARRKETEMTNETSTINQQHAQKVDAEIAKLIAETAKINAEARFYPLIVAVGFIAAMGTIVKIFAS